ncbi:MAG: ribosome maturation factor RimP [Pseudomonadota bacterium]
MRYNATEQKIVDIITPVMKEMGIDLLWLEHKGGILGIYAENPKTGKLTLDECTQISREISPILEVEDPIEGAYRLEVSSAGIDRPLLKPADYDRYHDLEAKIELDEMIEGQKKFRGYIRENGETAVTIETDQGKYDLPHASIVKAKLVMTDELIKETKKRFEIANSNLEQEVEVTV